MSIPYTDPRPDYRYMDKHDVMRELKMTRELLDWYTRQREVMRKKHNRRLAKLQAQFDYDSLPQAKRAWKDGKIDSYKWRQQLWRWDAIKREEQLRDDILTYFDTMIMNFQALKWFLEDMRDGKDTPKRPKYKQPPKRGATYRRPRQIQPAGHDYTMSERNAMRLKWHKEGRDK